MAREHTLFLPSRGETADLTAGAVSFVGTATVILRYGGFTILTDPNFLHRGDHVHLGFGLTSERLTEPAMELDALPPIDLVLLSHLHEDHFDRLVQEKLDRSLPIVTTPSSARSLSKMGFRSTHGLETWDSLAVTKGDAKLRLSAMPGKHAPGPLRLLLPPVMGTMLEFEDATGRVPLRLYVTGDTLLHDALREIPRRYPLVDMMLLHLGGTRIFGILLTMDGKQGIEVVKIVAPRLTLPIHYDDYTVFKSPLSDFQREVASAGLADRVRYLARGETYEFRVPEQPGRLGEERRVA
jgi:L-ascorbate metabolism protein UlaG (beta-lactamase superfamily)